MNEYLRRTADEYQRLMTDASALLDTADDAARRGDTATEQRAVDAATRLHDAASRIGVEE